MSNAKASKRAWVLRNPGKVAAQQRRWNELNKEKIQAQAKGRRERTREANRLARNKWRRAHRAYCREERARWAARHPDVAERIARRRAVKRYGIDLETYERLLDEQGGHCALCPATRETNRGHWLYVDHDHVTGVVRGLLCRRCNSTLGYMDEEPARLRRAADYLERYRGHKEALGGRGLQSILGTISEARGQVGRAESVEESQAVA